MVDLIKYPKTYHLPWSQTVHDDDKEIKNTSIFQGMEIIASEKLDGESTSMYSKNMHARSCSSSHNFTRDWAKKMHSILANDIPEGYIFNFENVAYCHSIEYDDLESFCYLLSIWKEDGYCLSYDDQCQWAEILDLAQPKVLYRGIYDEKELIKISKELDLNKTEGYVIRNANSFHRNDFAKNMGKFVRKDHIQPRSENGDDEHWLKNTYPNKLKDSSIVKPFYMSKTNANKIKIR